MTDAGRNAERLWATGDTTNGSWTNEPPPEKWGANATEYVRADLYAAAINRAETAEAERDALQAEVDRLRALGLAANAEWGSWVEDQWSGTSLFDEGAAQVENNRIALEAKP